MKKKTKKTAKEEKSKITVVQKGNRSGVFERATLLCQSGGR